MKKPVFFAGLLIVVLGGALLCANATGQNSQTESLGELARRARAQKSKEGTKPVKVYTNDNIPKNVQIGVAPSPTEAASENDATGETKKAGEAGVHNEKYFRDAMQKLQDRKQLHARELAVLQQKLGLNQTQYYPDPNKTLLQQYSRSDINRLQQDIDNKKAEIAADDQAMTDLEDQLRREGGDPGWIR